MRGVLMWRATRLPLSLFVVLMSLACPLYAWGADDLTECQRRFIAEAQQDGQGEMAFPLCGILQRFGMTAMTARLQGEPLSTPIDAVHVCLGAEAARPLQEVAALAYKMPMTAGESHAENIRLFGESVYQACVRRELGVD